MQTIKKAAMPRITAKQEGGDDGYCYVVRVNGAMYVNGLTRPEVRYYKRCALAEWCDRHSVEYSDALAALKL